MLARRVRTLAETLGRGMAVRMVDVWGSPGGTTLIVTVLVRVSYPLLGLPEGVRTAMDALVRLLVLLSLTWGALRVVTW